MPRLALALLACCCPAASAAWATGWPLVAWLWAGRGDKDATAAADDDAPPTTVLPDGPLRGDWAAPTGGGGPRVARFLAIPYAGDTSGPGRWAPPSPPVPWGPAVRDASRWGPACVQPYQGPGDPDSATDVSEDCLQLNVFTPVLGATPARPPAPVMLFFHGGAFVAGSARGPFDAYEGSALAARGLVVVVTAQYRLDAMGWLVTSPAKKGKDGLQEAGATGNYGLLDQRAALRWVRDNAAAFGGDGGRVTLWGESAGAMSGLVHLSSPPSAGLFSRLIQQSNPAGFTYMTADYMAVYGDALAGRVGCSKPRNRTTALDCLRGVPADALMAASTAVAKSYYDVARGSGWTVVDGMLQWGPVLDAEQLPEQPMARVAAGTLPAADVLLGHNSDEVATFVDTSFYARAFPSAVLDAVALSVFGLRGASAVKAVYASTPGGSLDELDAMMTDYWFRCAKEAVGAAAAGAGARAWSYRFDGRASFGPDMWPLFSLPQCVAKVCHGAELLFVFGNSGRWGFTPEERDFVAALQTAWANFAHTGDPNTPPAPVAARRLLVGGGGGRGGGGGGGGGLPPWPAFDNATRLTLVLAPVGGGTVDDSSTGNCVTLWDGQGYAQGGHSSSSGRGNKVAAAALAAAALA